MSGQGRVQDMKEVDLCSPQAARAPGPLSGGHTDQRQPAAAGAASQSRALASPLEEKE